MCVGGAAQLTLMALNKRKQLSEWGKDLRQGSEYGQKMCKMLKELIFFFKSEGATEQYKSNIL